MAIALETQFPNVRLIELSLDDFDAYYALVDRNRDHLTQHGDYSSMKTATPESIAETLRDYNGVDLRMGIWVGNQLAGRIDLLPKGSGKGGLGYWLGSEFTGRGYTTAACQALIEYGHTHLEIDEVYAGVTKGNVRSEAVLKRLGFTLIADMGSYNRFFLSLSEPG